MNKPSKSYLKVDYSLRPAKQVERRMIIDALGRLMNGGFAIREYQYTGFGSVYFFDFILLYKLVGLRKFVSVEYDLDIKKRVLFNRPFDLIEIIMEPVGDVLPRLSQDMQHILWLDYDGCMTAGMLHDSKAAAHRLSVGSLLLVTVDAEPPPYTENQAQRLDYFREEAGDFLPFRFDRSSCAISSLPAANLAILRNAIEGGLAARDARFIPLFKFVYKDGHRMVTLGGMIGNNAEKRKVHSCDWQGADYFRPESNDRPYEIKVPRLTSRERLFLDAHMPSSADWRPTEFELDATAVEAYREIHPFYPFYAELLV